MHLPGFAGIGGFPPVSAIDFLAGVASPVLRRDI